MALKKKKKYLVTFRQKIKNRMCTTDNVAIINTVLFWLVCTRKWQQNDEQLKEKLSYLEKTVLHREKFACRAVIFYSLSWQPDMSPEVLVCLRFLDLQDKNVQCFRVTDATKPCVPFQTKKHHLQESACLLEVLWAGVCHAWQHFLILRHFGKTQKNRTKLCYSARLGDAISTIQSSIKQANTTFP